MYRADPDEVRAELLRVLAQARAARSFPWDARRTLYWRTVFPQMTNWLPDEEAARLRFEFDYGNPAAGSGLARACHSRHGANSCKPRMACRRLLQIFGAGQ